MGEIVERLKALQDARTAFVKARELMNAARPSIDATPAERALYEERYKLDREAERALWREAMGFAIFAADADAAALILSLERRVAELEGVANGYRAAASFISADAWDGCKDCIDILRAARTVDIGWDWAGDTNRIAQELKRVRELNGDLGSIERGHVCKHSVRWPHSCQSCDDAAWAARSALNSEDGFSCP